MGAAQVGAAIGAAQVGAAQLATGAQQLGADEPQHLLWRWKQLRCVLWHRLLQQLERFEQQLVRGAQQLAAGAAQLAATGAAHVGAAGAQQVGAAAQQLFEEPQLPQRPQRKALASVAVKQQNSTAAAVNVVHFIIGISWNGVSDFCD